MWKAVIGGQLQQSALEIALDIAQRLQDPERTLEITKIAVEQSNLPVQEKHRFESYDLAHGSAAYALFFGQLDRCLPDQGYDRVAHTYITQAARGLEAKPPVRLAPALFGGLAGLCFSAFSLSRDGMRYQRLLRVLDSALVERAIEFTQLPDPLPEGAAFYDYDVISGPAGIGAYLLLRRQVPGVNEALEAILDRLLFLSEWHGDLLRFFVPPECLPSERHLERYPSGATDCGLAHGVPGPLAFLALARKHGVERPGLSEAIRRLADWLIANRCDDAYGPNWLDAVPPPGVSPSSFPTRAAWCYGGPGLARALWLAGEALPETSYRELAAEAILAIQRRPPGARAISSPILCHGVGGLLQVVLRFANDSGEAAFTEMAEELTREMIGMFEPATLVGYRDFELEGCRVDRPGLLMGAAGAALALLSAATDADPSWDRAFLLS